MILCYFHNTLLIILDTIILNKFPSQGPIFYAFERSVLSGAFHKRQYLQQCRVVQIVTTLCQHI